MKGKYFYWLHFINVLSMSIHISASWVSEVCILVICVLLSENIFLISWNREGIIF
jgi:hypothetical protein